MKHTVTDLNDPKDMVMFSRPILGNFSSDTFFEELEDELSHSMNPDKQSELLHSNEIVKLDCTFIDLSNDASIGSSSCILVKSNHCTQNTNHNLWTMYFDISSGVDVGYLLIDPCGIRTYFSYHLESKCTNNGAKYEALIQGLRKVINLKVKSIEVFGDSRLVIKQVRNFMFNTFYHLNNYQQ